MDYKKTEKQTGLNWAVLTTIALLSFLVTAYSGIRKSMKNLDKKETIIVSETFQEIGFFGEIKKEKWEDFLKAVQKNIVNSRKEQGNVSFYLFQPENKNLQPIWFERFKDKKAHNQHKEQDYFKEAVAVIQQSLTSEAKSIELKELEEIPAALSKISTTPEKSQYSIQLLEVKPERRQLFITILTALSVQSRKEKGNLEFNIYQYADNPNSFVLMEGWETATDYEHQKHHESITKHQFKMNEILVSNLLQTHWLLNDISQ